MHGPLGKVFLFDLFDVLGLKFLGSPTYIINWRSIKWELDIQVWHIYTYLSLDVRIDVIQIFGFQVGSALTLKQRSDIYDRFSSLFEPILNMVSNPQVILIGNMITLLQPNLSSAFEQPIHLGTAVNIFEADHLIIGACKMKFFQEPPPDDRWRNNGWINLMMTGYDHSRIKGRQMKTVPSRDEVSMFMFANRLEDYQLIGLLYRRITYPVPSAGEHRLPALQESPSTRTEGCSQLGDALG